MIRIFLILLIIVTFVHSERRFSPFRSAFRISGQSSLARNNDDDLNESHITLLPGATRSKQTTPFNIATTKKKIISTLLEMTENEISKKLNQLDSAENNEVLSSNNKRFFKNELSTVVTEKSDSATSSLFELSTEASIKQTSAQVDSSSTTAKPIRKQIKITTSSSRDSIAAAEAAALAIANMHSMAFKPSSNLNRVSNTATSKIPVHHHNPYNDYAQHDKINFDVNYRPTEAAPVQSASSAPAKKAKDKNRESVKNLLNGLVNFVSSPLFTQAKPLIVSSFSTVSNALSSNRNVGGSSSSSNSNSASALNSGVISKMFNSLRYAVLRRNEATTNANKNSKKKGKLNSAINNTSNNNQSNQSILMSLLDSLIKTRGMLSMGVISPNKSTNKPVKLGSSSTNNKNTLTKPTYSNTILNLFNLLYKQPGLKQEARSI